MAPFPTSKQVFDRIRWDSALNPLWFTIGFVERESEGGIAEMPLINFSPDGDVPWHRLRYFKIGAFVVWDRAQRIDRLAEVREAARASGEEFSLPAI